jgi:hypothetical protein
MPRNLFVRNILIALASLLALAAAYLLFIEMLDAAFVSAVLSISFFFLAFRFQIKERMQQRNSTPPQEFENNRN